MASNHNALEDQNIRKRLLSLREQNYNTDQGWEKLSAHLTPQSATVGKRTPGKILPLWKMIAAAIILLAAGFFTGRMSSTPAAIQNTELTRKPTTRNKAIAGKENTGARTSNNIAFSQQGTVSPKITGKKTEAQPPEKGRISNKNSKGESGNKKYYTKRNYLTPPRSADAASTTVKLALSTDQLGKEKGDNVNNDKAGKVADVLKRAEVATANVLPTTEQTAIRPAADTRPTGKLSTAHALPVISLAASGALSSIPDLQREQQPKSIFKESIYKKIERQNGASTNNPFKIRL